MGRRLSRSYTTNGWAEERENGTFFLAAFDCKVHREEPVPLQIFAYRSAQLAQVDMARTHLGADTLLDGRILELLRIRSAQLGECEPCSESRKHDSITDEDVACLLAPARDALTAQEQLAVEFIDRLSGDHHSIDDEFYRRLGEQFTAADVIIGSNLRWGMMFDLLPKRPEFVAYVSRLEKRPALQRAVAKDQELAAA